MRPALRVALGLTERRHGAAAAADPWGEPTLLWHENHDTAGEETHARLTAWYEDQASPTDDSADAGASVSRPTSGASQNQALSGTWSMRSTIGVTADASAGARIFRRVLQTANPLEPYYYGSWFHLPVTVAVGTFWMHQQWKIRNDSGGGQGVAYALYIYNPAPGQMAYRLTYKLNEDQGVAGPFAGGSDSEPYHELSEVLVPEDEWYHVETYFAPARDYTGRVVVRMNGETLFDWKNVITMPAEGDYLNPWHITNYARNCGIGEAVGNGSATINMYNDDATMASGGWIYGSAIEPWS